MKIRARSQHRRYPYWYEGFYLNPPDKPGEYPCVLESISDSDAGAPVASGRPWASVRMDGKLSFSIHVIMLSRSRPNQGMRINALVLHEAKDSSEIERIVTTYDGLFRRLP